MFSLTHDGPVARITIDRGSNRNAVPMAAWATLEKLVRCANTSSARMTVFASPDPNSFCAGSDLSELVQLTHDPLKRKRFRGAMGSAFGAIRATNKPTIALIRGGCFGTGVGLATACDLRIAHPDARFAITPARFGISYPDADLRAIVELVGRGQAARLLYTAETIGAAEALRIGLVDIVDDGDAFGEDIIRSIAANAPYSLCSLKASLLGRFGVDERFDRAFEGDAFATGISSYAEAKRR